MLSSCDEAFELEFRPERISYHGVYSYSFFISNIFAHGRAGKVSLFLGRQLSTFHKKAIFFPAEKNFSHINLGYYLLKRNISPVTVEGLFLVS